MFFENMLGVTEELQALHKCRWHEYDGISNLFGWKNLIDKLNAF